MINKTILTCAVVFGAIIGSQQVSAQSQQEAADKAYQMAVKYSAMQYYITPSREGRAGFGTTLEFNIPVNLGLDYVFIIGGDKYTQDLDVWIESEAGNTIVKDTRPIQNGMAGVSWRSDYNGSAKVVVHFARVSSRTAWAALIGRRGNPMVQSNENLTNFGTTPPGQSTPAAGTPSTPEVTTAQDAK